MKHEIPILSLNDIKEAFSTDGIWIMEMPTFKNENTHEQLLTTNYIINLSPIAISSNKNIRQSNNNQLKVHYKISVLFKVMYDRFDYYFYI